MLTRRTIVAGGGSAVVARLVPAAQAQVVKKLVPTFHGT